MHQRRLDPRPAESGVHGALSRQPDVCEEHRDVPETDWSRTAQLKINREDEIIRETLVTHGGEVVNPRVNEATGPGQRGSMPVKELMGGYEFDLCVFMLATFLGFQLIRGVSPLLHTPLMSLTNAISAIAVVGAILLTGEQDATHAQQGAGLLAVAAAVTQHRQRLSDHRPHAEDVQEAGAEKK